MDKRPNPPPPPAHVRVAWAAGYRGDAVWQVVLAGEAEQFVLWQLEAAERTRGGLLLQLGRVRTSAEGLTTTVNKRLSDRRPRGAGRPDH